MISDDIESVVVVVVTVTSLQAIGRGHETAKRSGASDEMRTKSHAQRLGAIVRLCQSGTVGLVY